MKSKLRLNLSISNIIGKNFSTVPGYFKKSFKQTSVFNGFKFNPSTVGLVKNKLYRGSKDGGISRNLFEVEKNLPIIKTSSTELKGKELIKQLESEYYQELSSNVSKIKNFEFEREIPKFGDYVELQYYLSLSSKKINNLKGYIVSVYDYGTFNFRFELFFEEEGQYGKISIPFYSPILKKLKVINRQQDIQGDQLIGLKNLRYFGHLNKMLMKTGKINKVNKKDKKKVREYLRNEKLSELNEES